MTTFSPTFPPGRRALAVGVFFAVFSVFSQVPDAQAGKLKQLRNETRGSSSSSSKSSSSSSGDYDSGGGGGDSIMALYVMTSPWWLPYHFCGDRYGRNWAFADYPYANGADGYARLEGVSRPVTLQDGRQYLGQSAAITLRAEGGTLTSDGPFDQNLARLTLGGTLRTNFRLRLDTEWTLWTEDLVQDKDQLWLGKANATLVFAQTEHVRFYSGMGLRFLVDDEGTESGINFLYGLEVFPASPLVLSAQFEAGSLGMALATQVRVSAGMVFRGIEIFVAYDRLSVNQLVFGGPVVGLRSWH